MPVESERASDAGWREVAFQRSPPLPSYLLAFAVGEFDVVDAGRAGTNGTPISIVVPKGRAAEARYAAANTGPILAAAERFFGTPYPFPKLDLLAYPEGVLRRGDGESGARHVYGAARLLARPEEISPVFEQRFAGITAHEIAHMWFGDYVTMPWWNDLLAQRVVRLVARHQDRDGNPSAVAVRVALAPAHQGDRARPASTARARCASPSPTSATSAPRSTASPTRRARRSSPCSSSGSAPTSFATAFAAMSRSTRGPTPPPTISSRRSPEATTRSSRRFARLPTVPACRCSTWRSTARARPRSRSRNSASFPLA